MAKPIAVSPHPASFSTSVMEMFGDMLRRYCVPEPGRLYRVLDPMAGIGRVHAFGDRHISTTGIEIEEEWAKAHGKTITGDLFVELARRQNLGRFDVVMTSPTYGNRMADHHNAKDPSHRRTYRHYLGRQLSKNNSGGMQWGEDYRQFHETAWVMVYFALKPNGMFLLNISNHIRKGVEIDVVGFHVKALKKAGFMVVKKHKVETARYRFGANSQLRASHEYIIEAYRPEN